VNAPRYVALCQDCGAPHEFANEALQMAAHRGQYGCQAGECAGELCACLDCQRTSHVVAVDLEKAMGPL
jgi:hypothetical protein